MSLEVGTSEEVAHVGVGISGAHSLEGVIVEAALVSLILTNMAIEVALPL